MLRAPTTLGLLLAALLAGPAIGQDGERAPEPTPPSNGPQKMLRLLREGSFLDGVNGTLLRDQVTGWWALRPERRPDDWAQRDLPYEIVLLPNHRLEDMEQIVRSSRTDRGVNPVFEVSGEIFVYGSRNFLLVAHAPLLAEPTEAPADPEPRDADEEEPDGDADSVEDIMKELAAAVGPLQYRAKLDARQPDARPIPEGSVLVNRRGQLDRSADGASIFVFNADASGLRDPPLVVMPCLMLQRIEQYARRAGRNATLVLNGRVFQYGGRGYVLPTLFRVPRQRTALAP